MFNISTTSPPKIMGLFFAKKDIIMMPNSSIVVFKNYNPNHNIYTRLFQYIRKNE